MPSSRSQKCWPNYFVVKCLAGFFGAVIIGIGIGALTYHKPAAPPPPTAPAVQPVQCGIIVYVGNRGHLVQAGLNWADAQKTPGPSLGTTTYDPNNPLRMSRLPGDHVYFIITWKGKHMFCNVAEWPRSPTPLYYDFVPDSQ